MIASIQTWILENKLRSTDCALAANEEALKRAVPESYERQELESTRRGLIHVRCTTEAKLRALAKPSPAETEAQARHKAKLDALIQRRSRRIESFIEKLEREGDHRQAKIWRLELARVPEQIAQEYRL